MGLRLLLRFNMASFYYDIHVHIAGRGDGSTGCWFSPQRWDSIAFRLIRWSLGLRREERDLDGALRARLLSYASSPSPDIEELPVGEGSLKIVVLAHDWPRDAEGKILADLADFYVPNDYVLHLAQTSPHLLAGASIHPYRPDALNELDRCCQGGAVLIKWLPTSQNFSPADARCRPFYEEMARRGLPLLCHTGSEGATRNLDKRVNDPRVLIPALEAGVVVIAAHSGLRSSPHDADYFETWYAMLKDYPHLYGDTAVSYTHL
ncbi:MAG: amidohydrolase family protein, partial [Planctomycetota bacterium]|nr:amidohydrolase family protein [Planctomycetota bacterium]